MPGKWGQLRRGSSRFRTIRLKSGTNPLKIQLKSGRSPSKTCVFRGTRCTPTAEKVNPVSLGMQVAVDDWALSIPLSQSVRRAVVVCIRDVDA